MTLTLFARLSILTLLLFTAAYAARADDLSPVNVRVIGRNNMLWRGPAAVRVIVTDERTGQPVRANVSIAIGDSHGGAAKPMFYGISNAEGTVDADFRVATRNSGSHTLLVDVQSPIGADSFSEPVTLTSAAQLLLTCDKPIYQPGQIIHIRALARDIATGRALAHEPLTFEVEDARGNKVYKSHQTLSPFGVASDDFQLADEVNMGTFTLRAITADDTAEKKVQVSQYVLPKFKVAVDTAHPYYLPGQTLTGSLKADYFFGKPLNDASVHLSLNTVDIGVTELAVKDGRTDSSGNYTFSFRLPESFIGQPIDQGKARVEVAATVTDTANQVQQANTSVPVVQSPVVLALVPESRGLVPHVGNRVYIAAATPDGQPLVNCPVSVSLDNNSQRQSLTTDDLGLATYSFTPPSSDTHVSIHATATDKLGQRGSSDLGLDGTPDSEGLILRTDKNLAKVGDVLHLDALSSSKNGTLYIDVIRDGQTILTQSAPIANGIASLPLRVTPDMTGTIELHAYKILANEDIIRDTRLVIVSPADDLTITMTADHTQYRPGDDARIDFTVRDRSGAGVATALGIAIVDESVFALSELQPGLEKVYFTLEKELMDPKYEIHGLTPTGLIEMPTSPLPRIMFARQRGAAMLLANAPSSSDFDYNTDTFDNRYKSFIEKTITAEMLKSYGDISNALDQYQKSKGGPLTVSDGLLTLVHDGYLSAAALKDHWGNEYRVDTYGQSTYQSSNFRLNSAGLDGKWGTGDDILNFIAWPQFQPDGRKTFINVAGSQVTKSSDGYNFEQRVMLMGGFGGGGAFGAGARAVFAAPMALAPQMGALQENGAMDSEDRLKGAASTIADSQDNSLMKAQAAPPRLRQYFPETMYWNPSLITDDSGHAEMSVPLADSITTWRASIMGNTESGLLGSTSAPIRVFQDFFVDMDLPVNMTQHDHVDLPVVVYNYLPAAQNVEVTLTPEAWFSLTGPNTRTVHVGAGDVKSVSFPITIVDIGQHDLTVVAHGQKMSDAVKKPIEVVPDGKEVDTVINDQLVHSADNTVDIPGDAIDGASSIWVKIYPGTFSQVVDGLDGLLRMPNGCFEQTSSSTYPDVLVLDYLKQTKKINPEMQLQAEQYINIGYQRLVTFECHNGGFSWFGDEPANQILTAYGLLEFSDMSHVHDVDPALISRTASWLASKQRADGSYLETNQGIAEGIINRQTGALRTTAYVGWALSEAGYKGGQLDKALDYVRVHASESKDPYTQAVILNFLDSAAPHSSAADTAAESLMSTAKTDAKSAYWVSDTQTFTGAQEEGADLETTGLAAYALSRYGRLSSFTTKVLTHLVQSKTAFGCWSTTQGTVWSLKALLYAGEHSVGGGGGRITVSANGQNLQTINITAADSDVMRQVSLGQLAHTGSNDIKLSYKGDGSPLYQIVGRYYVPWLKVPLEHTMLEPLTIGVVYDKTKLAATDTANVTVTIHNQTDRRAEMPLVDLGIPPGFTVIADKLDTAKSEGSIDKYTLTGRQIIVYMQKLDPESTVTLHYSLQAKYPIKVQTPLSKVYPYYNPEKASISKPQELTVN
jgi:uncharacterized protein YfaS (alpha-2-macroglobulin family)